MFPRFSVLRNIEQSVFKLTVVHFQSKKFFQLVEPQKRGLLQSVQGLLKQVAGSVLLD